MSDINLLSEKKNIFEMKYRTPGQMKTNNFEMKYRTPGQFARKQTYFLVLPNVGIINSYRDYGGNLGK